LFRPLPTHAEPGERDPDRLARDPLIGDPLGEAHLRCQIERPEAGRLVEGAWRLVQEDAQPFGSHRIKGDDPVGAGRSLAQGVPPPPVEGMDRVADGLVVAAQVRGDLRSALAARGGEEDLATAEGEGIGRAESDRQCLAFGIHQRADEDRRSHAPQDTTFTMTSSD